MPTPARPLTNDHRNCNLVKLDASEANSPLVVVQEAYAPGDPTYRMRMFYLQRDGLWIDEIARSTRPDAELADIIFETSTEALNVLSSLVGTPMIRNLPVTEADAKAYMARAKTGSSEQLFRDALARYRAARAGT